MLKHVLPLAATLILVAAAAAWWATRPLPLASDQLSAHEPDPKNGERQFWAGSCASCHATPVDGRRAKGEDRLRLGGGAELETPFGKFRMPNISPDEATGIGKWSVLDFVNAMQRGVSPDGRHYYPAFPYTSYARMATEDVIDLFAFLKTLEPIASDIDSHELAFPWGIRRGIGLWKRRYLNAQPIANYVPGDGELELGRTLVEGVGHCGECHTPRDRWGGLDYDRWLAGAPSLAGRGRVPGLDANSESFELWTADDIAYYLESGFTPEFDAVGGSMVAVQENMAMLEAADRRAIARYLKAAPTLDDAQ